MHRRAVLGGDADRGVGEIRLLLGLGALGEDAGGRGAGGAGGMGAAADNVVDWVARVSPVSSRATLGSARAEIGDVADELAGAGAVCWPSEPIEPLLVSWTIRATRTRRPRTIATKMAITTTMFRVARVS